ncbi:JmjC domain-containing protein [Thermostaphylospora chromogena]|uniref:Ribosomal protein L16 Arg81 hydroxylase, contains JmjC domain n=1 Tax=Thermostaphylospora chromogena TaxID=35622 RepID=A0A1H1FTV2_9ACTN|nr:cupin domain-containing protein [Thermostaphylospora chromogena]SDR04427.1 Ribosomal protein L16 Arg81 hydroxylase, contains JmjC domain [Thermostaphylospora chromogena]
MSVLDRITGGAEAFLKEHWTRSPVLFRPMDGLPGLPCFDDVVRLLRSGVARPPYVRLEGPEGAPIPPSLYTETRKAGRTVVRDFVHAGRFAEHIMRGATAVVHEFQLFSEPVRELCDALGEELGETFTSAVFITPPDERGLALHHDNMDVFALQLEGRKHWIVHEKTGPTPDRGRIVPPSAAGPVALEVTLRPGDCLYVPAGAPHVATSVDGMLSAHLSVGGKPVTWRELLLDSVRRVLARPDFDGAPNRAGTSEDRLAAAFAAKSALLRDLLARDAEEGTFGTRYAASLTAGPHPPTGGGDPFAQTLTALSLLNGDDWDGLRVRLRDGASVTGTGPGERVAVLAGGRRVETPERWREALARLSTGPLPLREAAAAWGADEVRALISTLIRHGAADLLKGRGRRDGGDTPEGTEV